MYRSFILWLPLFCASLAIGQVSELGVTGGVTYYIGDLNPTKHYPPNTHLAAGALYRYNFDNRYAFRLQGLYSKLEAYDSDSDEIIQQRRNLHFKTSLFEAAGIFEVNFFEYRSGREKKMATPYMFAGLAYFRTNPKAKLNDEWYELQPLGTEGQGSSAMPNSEPYKIDQVAIPFGVGLKISLGRFDLGLEWGLRKTWTDYIDDVSGLYVDSDLLAFENGPLTAALADPSLDDPAQPSYNKAGTSRGNGQTTDWYQFTGITFTYVLGPRFVECHELYERLN